MAGYLSEKMSTVTQPLTLEEFSKLPETKPVSELINGEIIQFEYSYSKIP
jgi:hypothetical protein